MLKSLMEKVSSKKLSSEEEKSDGEFSILIESDTSSIACRVCNVEYEKKSKKHRCDVCKCLCCEGCIVEKAILVRESGQQRVCKSCYKGETPGECIREIVLKELEPIKSRLRERLGQSHIPPKDPSQKSKSSILPTMLLTSLVMKSNKPNIFLLHIKRIEAKGLKNVEIMAELGDQNDPYAILSLTNKDGWSAVTSVLEEGGSDVFWDCEESDPDWYVELTREELQNECLRVTVKDKNHITSDVLIGEGEIPLKPLLEREKDRLNTTLYTHVFDRNQESTGVVKITAALVDILSRPKSSDHSSTNSASFSSIPSSSPASGSSRSHFIHPVVLQRTSTHLAPHHKQQPSSTQGTNSRSSNKDELPALGYFELSNKSEEMVAVKVVIPPTVAAGVGHERRRRTVHGGDSGTGALQATPGDEVQKGGRESRQGKSVHKLALVHEAVFPKYITVPPYESVHVCLDPQTPSLCLMLLYGNPHPVPLDTPILYDTTAGTPRRSISPCAAVASFKEVALYTIEDCEGCNVLLKYKGDGVVEVRSASVSRWADGFLGRLFGSYIFGPALICADDDEVATGKIVGQATTAHYRVNVKSIQLLYRSSEPGLSLPVPPPGVAGSGGGGGGGFCACICVDNYDPPPPPTPQGTKDTGRTTAASIGTEER